MTYDPDKFGIHELSNPNLPETDNCNKTTNTFNNYTVIT
jgi:hypothetical protein